MKKRSMAFWLLPLALTFGEGKKNLSLFTAIDFGRVENGKDFVLNYDPEGMALNRTYVNVGFSEQLDDTYFLSIGVGGIFWKAFEGEGGLPQDKVIKFGPGISNAFMKMTLNDRMDLTFGYFPYKYNQSAKNLGEYLFRTEAIPTVIYTGGWSYMNDASYNAVGAKFSWTLGDGVFKQDLGLFGEYFNSPIYDITPAYIATWKPATWMTFGGAGSLHRYFTPTPKVKDELTKDYLYYKDFFVHAIPADTANGVEGRAAVTQSMLKADIDGLISKGEGDSASLYGNALNQGKTAQTVSFDLAAVKLVGFFDLDFNGMFGWEEENVGKFNLYGEVAQLGLKNYPIFYTKYSERMPMMLGFSLPTMGILNHLSFEVESLKNPNIESIAGTYDKLDLVPDDRWRYKVFSKDDTKWTIHAGRNLSKFLSVYVQVANDHLRLKSGYATPEYVPMTNETKHWYWLTRLQWMI